MNLEKEYVYELISCTYDNQGNRKTVRKIFKTLKKCTGVYQSLKTKFDDIYEAENTNCVFECFGAHRPTGKTIKIYCNKLEVL